MLLVETKIQTEVYSHNQLGYNVTFLESCPSSARGAQGDVYGDKGTAWQVRVESTSFHGPNMVSYKIVTGHTCTPLVVAYLPLSVIDHIPDVKEALK